MYFQSILTVSMILLRCTAFTCYAVVVMCGEWTHVFLLVDFKWNCARLWVCCCWGMKLSILCEVRWNSTFIYEAETEGSVRIWSPPSGTKIQDFWNVMPCRLTGTDISEEIASSIFRIHVIFFDCLGHEDGGSNLLQNVGNFYQLTLHHILDDMNFYEIL
jgi:hypothetical protein